MKSMPLILSFVMMMVFYRTSAQTPNTAGASSGGAAQNPATGVQRQQNGVARQQNSQAGQQIAPVAPNTVRTDQIVSPNQVPVDGIATNQIRPPNTNQFGGATNRFAPGTNFLTATNQSLFQTNQIVTTPTPGSGTPAWATSNLPPATAPAVAGGVSNLPAALLQDRAIMQNDRTLLVQIRRNLRGVFPSPTSLANVHFQIQQGTVAIVGNVPTLEQKQRILQIVRATPSITTVVDQLQVKALAGNVSSPPPFVVYSNQAGVPIPSPTGRTNFVFPAPANGQLPSNIVPTVP